jgi:hypothetical protein
MNPLKNMGADVKQSKEGVKVTTTTVLPLMGRLGCNTVTNDHMF